MASKRSLVLAVLTIGLSSPMEAYQPPNGRRAPAGKSTVLKAIAALQKEPLSDDVDEKLALIVEFAERSEDADIMLDEKVLPGETIKRDPRLIGFYIAGAVQFDLAHPDKMADPSADMEPGLRSLLLYYRAKVRKDPSGVEDYLERVDQADKSGGLGSFIQKRFSKGAKGK